MQTHRLTNANAQKAQAAYTHILTHTSSVTKQSNLSTHIHIYFFHILYAAPILQKQVSCNTFAASMSHCVLTLQNITAFPESCVWAWPHLHAQHKDVSGARKPIALSQKENKTTQQIHTRPGKNQIILYVCACVYVVGGGVGVGRRNDCELRTAHRRSLPKGTLTGLCPDVWEVDRDEHDKSAGLPATWHRCSITDSDMYK